MTKTKKAVKKMNPGNEIKEYDDLTLAYMAGYHKRDDIVNSLKKEIEVHLKELAEVKGQLGRYRTLVGELVEMELCERPMRYIVEDVMSLQRRAKNI